MDVKRYDATLDLDEIERLAKEADPLLPKDIGYNIRGHYDVDESVVQFIAHLTPARVMALVERARESDDIVDQWRAVHARLEADLATERDARKKAEAERDAATREAEICKAIIKHCGGSFVVKCMLCGKPFDVRDPDWLKHDLACPKHPMRDVERERDALARRMRVVDMRVVACWRSDNTYWLDYPSGRIAPVICALNDDARANGYWPTAGQALDAAATALEKAGLMGEGRDGK
jgi:hypothetical protein